MKSNKFIDIFGMENLWYIEIFSGLLERYDGEKI